MNTKAKGSRFENAVKKEWQEMGFFVARQAASLFPDLLALGGNMKVAIECKASRNGRLSLKEKKLFELMKQEITDLACILATKDSKGETRYLVIE